MLGSRQAEKEIYLSKELLTVTLHNSVLQTTLKAKTIKPSDIEPYIVIFQLNNSMFTANF